MGLAQAISLSLSGTSETPFQRQQRLLSEHPRYRSIKDEYLLNKTRRHWEEAEYRDAYRWRNPWARDYRYPGVPWWGERGLGRGWEGETRDRWGRMVWVRQD